MGKTYTTPSVLEYGRLDRLTLGQHGTLPDYNQDGTHYVNDNCADDTVTGKGKSGDSDPFTCGVAVAS